MFGSSLVRGSRERERLSVLRSRKREMEESTFKMGCWLCAFASGSGAANIKKICSAAKAAADAKRRKKR